MEILAPSIETHRKILNCYVSASAGGLGTVFINISNFLFSQGYDISVVFQYFGGELEGEINNKIRCYSLGYEGKLSYLKMLIKFVEIIQRVSPDVVLSHSWNMNVIIMLAKLISRIKFKTILFEHRSPYTYFEESWLIGSFKNLTLKFLYKYTDFLVVVSTGIKKTYTKKFGINSEKILIIHPPMGNKEIIRLANESCPELLVEDRIPIIISVGNLNSNKNYILLIDAFYQLLQKFDSKLLIVGEGQERKRLEKHIKELQIENRIYLTGYQPNPYKYMGKSTIYVSTSKNEGFGISIVEAMTLGLPVIATYTDGAKEILQDGRYGVLVKHESRAISSAIYSLLLDKGRYGVLSAKGRIRARHFQITNSLNSILELMKYVNR